MPDLHLTFPGQSRSKLIVTNERYDFLSIISNKFGRICRCYQVTGNKLDLDLTSPGHSRSKQMSPNERPHITSTPSSIVILWLS